METKIIIICGILIVAVFLLGLFRLWWLRKCYDKARTEKRDVLPSEQVALADKLLKTYSKARSTTWKSMGIALAVIAILGTAVWGFNRIAQTTKAEKEQAKVEESVLLSWLDYLSIYFDEDKAFRYQGQKVSLKYQQAFADYKKCQAALEQAQDENNDTEVVIQRTYLNDAQLILNEAIEYKNNFETFPEKWRQNSDLCWIILVDVICCVFLLYLQKVKYWKDWDVVIFLASCASLIIFAIMALIVPLFTLRDFVHYVILGIDVILLVNIGARNKRQN